jgi:hypothetical protein
MLVEEDHARDLSSSKVKSAWRTAADVVWKAHMLSVFAATLGGATHRSTHPRGGDGGRGSDGGPGVDPHGLPIGNDDLIGRPQQVVVDSGSPATHEFVGEADATEDGSARLLFRYVAREASRWHALDLRPRRERWRFGSAPRRSGSRANNLLGDLQLAGRQDTQQPARESEQRGRGW